MKAVLKAAALALLLGAMPGCQVNVDNQSKANLDNAAATVGAAADEAGNAVGRGADAIGSAVEQGADAVDNRVDVNVNLHGDGNEAAAQNKQ
jgi:hypothetical protein